MVWEVDTGEVIRGAFYVSLSGISASFSCKVTVNGDSIQGMTLSVSKFLEKPGFSRACLCGLGYLYSTHICGLSKCMDQVTTRSLPLVMRDSRGKPRAIDGAGTFCLTQPQAKAPFVLLLGKECYYLPQVPGL